MKAGKKVVLAVCGSVAAIEAPRVVREIIRKGYEVECVMSDGAQEIIHPNALEWASQNRVVTKLGGGAEHVRLCGMEGEASLLLIYPGTANTISKIACGISDTPVTTLAATALGSGIQVAIAPAMHLSLYQNPFVKGNIQKLKEAGVHLIEPLCSGYKAKIAGVDTVTGYICKTIK